MPTADQGFSCEILHLDGSVLLLLRGQLDAAGAEQLRASTAGLERRYDLDQVTFDCSELTFVDVHGVDQLVAVVKRFGPTGPPTLREPSPWLLQVLARTDTEQLFRTQLEDAS